MGATVGLVGRGRRAEFFLRLMDEEIAIGSTMLANAAWACKDGPAPYPLAKGCQDQLISLAVDTATSTGVPVTVGVEGWAR